MLAHNYTRGLTLFLLAIVVFALQDGVSKYLAERYSVFTIVMIRYWAFLVFVLVLSALSSGGIKKVAASGMPKMQFARGVLLAAQVCSAAYLFARLGLVDTHVVFASYPLLVTLFSIPLLGEKVGWQRGLAVTAGFIGVIVIIKPTSAVFQLVSLLPLISAAAFALYNIMTRYVSRTDSGETSFFWTGVGGFIFMTLVGPFFWAPPIGNDWYWMVVLCFSGALGHYLMIKALEIAEASSLQPFSFLQLVFAGSIGVLLFDEIVTANIIIGGGIIVGAGLFTIWRERVRANAG